jgi:hypothetical protein
MFSTAMRKFSPKKAEKFEARQVARIRKWRGRRPGFVARSAEFLVTPIVWTFRRAIPASAVEATLHGNLWLARRWAREGTTLRALGVSDATQLAEIELLHSDRVVRRIHRRAVLMAGGMGFVAGIFGFLTLPVAMAGALNIALRTIHRIGLCYGYPAHSEAERLFVYYTLSLAGTQRPEERAVSLQALRELQATIAAAPPSLDETPAEGMVPTEIRDKAFTIAHHDFSREITKQLVQVRLLTSIPGIGGLIAIIVDTNYMRSVGWAARHAYQLRWLQDRGRLPEGI